MTLEDMDVDCGNRPLRIGIITGSGPQAGIDLWQRILALNQSIIESTREYKGDKDAPHVVIHSVPALGGPHGFHDLEKSSPDYKLLMEAMEQTIMQISQSCDVFCICCHTLHYLEQDIRDFVDKMRANGDSRAVAHFLSIVDCTADVIATCGAKKVSILGSNLISDVDGKSPYKRIGKIPGILCSAASNECRKKQQELIIAAKRDGPESQESQDLMVAVLKELDEMDLLVLACTELPLVMAGSKCSAIETCAQLFNPTQELARRLLIFDPACALDTKTLSERAFNKNSCVTKNSIHIKTIHYTHSSDASI